MFIAIVATYKIKVTTSKEFGSGTCANVYIIIFGKHLLYKIREDRLLSYEIGKVPLSTSKTHNDPFESGHTDEFEIEAMDIGEPIKIKYEMFF